MKTDDDLARSSSDKYKRGGDLVTQLNYKPNYTERSGYQEDPLLESHMKTELSTSQRTKGLLK